MTPNPAYIIICDSKDDAVFLQSVLRRIRSAKANTCIPMSSEEMDATRQYPVFASSERVIFLYPHRPTPAAAAASPSQPDASPAESDPDLDSQEAEGSTPLDERKLKRRVWGRVPAPPPPVLDSRPDPQQSPPDSLSPPL